MKKLFTFVAAALVSASAFAQAHCKWTVEQLPQQVFAGQAAAVEAGFVTMWWAPDNSEGGVGDAAPVKWMGMPACDLINNDYVQVSLPLDYNYVSVGNGKYSGKDYAYKLIMGMNNSTRDGIDVMNFAEGLTNNSYVRKAGNADQKPEGSETGYVINDAIIKINVKSASYGAITLTYNRGGNNSAMYVVDSTKTRSILWSVTRSTDDNVQHHVARFGVEPGHTYYVMASEKGSVELYGIEYDECTDEDYEVLATADNCTDLWTAAQLPNEVFAGQAAAVAAGYTTMWWAPDTSEGGVGDAAPVKWMGMPACDLINSANIKVSLPLDYNYVSVGNGKYSGKDYAYKLIMGMNNSTRDGIDVMNFAEGLTNNSYVRKAGNADQKPEGSETGYVINDAIIKINVPADGNYGRVILNYNRGGNNSAMYVVDSTKTNQVLQTVNRCPDDAVKTHTAIFNVQPNHTYYVMASEKGSVELYAIGYCSATDAKYAALGVASGIKAIENVAKTAVNNNMIYTISGRMVGTNREALSKGLYIQNGKKFVK